MWFIIKIDTRVNLGTEEYLKAETVDIFHRKKEYYYWSSMDINLKNVKLPTNMDWNLLIFTSVLDKAYKFVGNYDENLSRTILRGSYLIKKWKYEEIYKV